jgi:hypothetical protein
MNASWCGCTRTFACNVDDRAGWACEHNRAVYQVGFDAPYFCRDCGAEVRTPTPAESARGDRRGNSLMWVAVAS